MPRSLTAGRFTEKYAQHAQGWEAMRAAYMSNLNRALEERRAGALEEEMVAHAAAAKAVVDARNADPEVLTVFEWLGRAVGHVSRIVAGEETEADELARHRSTEVQLFGITLFNARDPLSERLWSVAQSQGETVTSWPFRAAAWVARKLERDGAIRSARRSRRLSTGSTYYWATRRYTPSTAKRVADIATMHSTVCTITWRRTSSSDSMAQRGAPFASRMTPMKARRRRFARTKSDPALFVHAAAVIAACSARGLIRVIGAQAARFPEMPFRTPAAMEAHLDEALERLVRAPLAASPEGSVRRRGSALALPRHALPRRGVLVTPP